ncbi:MAG: DUF1572 family protein [Flavobacteriales bacterium]
MLIPELKTQFLAGIDRIESELDQYQSEERLWVIEGSLSNSGGNLMLHLVGNLRHFIGHVVGKNDYVRQRELEFSSKNIVRTDIKKLIAECRTEVESTFETLDDSGLDIQFPVNIANREWTTREFIFHLLGHLNYHIGQINYHRRLLDR